MSLAETLGDQGRLVQAVSMTANALWQMGDNVRAHAFAQRGLSLAEAVGDAVLLIEIGLNLGMILCTMGDYRRAAVVLAKPVALLQGDLARARLGRALYPAVRARVTLTQCLAELGEFRQASATAEEGIRSPKPSSNPAAFSMHTTAPATFSLARASSMTPSHGSSAAWRGGTRATWRDGTTSVLAHWATLCDDGTVDRGVPAA